MYWQGTSVKKILQNPHYVGDLVQGREATLNVTNKKKGVFKRRGLGCCPKYP
ncbi:MULTISPECIES: recombinase family protein [Paenibacillus]|uniref:recombinase family protein n=1 Tax=Paenibacillus TaxID=44249 RepID=UPI0039E10EEC